MLLGGQSSEDHNFGRENKGKRNMLFFNLDLKKLCSDEATIIRIRSAVHNSRSIFLLYCLKKKMEWYCFNLLHY